jgi:hypothetical protein
MESAGGSSSATLQHQGKLTHFFLYVVIGIIKILITISASVNLLSVLLKIMKMKDVDFAKMYKMKIFRVKKPKSIYGYVRIFNKIGKIKNILSNRYFQ